MKQQTTEEEELHLPLFDIAWPPCQAILGVASKMLGSQEHILQLSTQSLKACPKDFPEVFHQDPLPLENLPSQNCKEAGHIEFFQFHTGEKREYSLEALDVQNITEALALATNYGLV